MNKDPEKPIPFPGAEYAPESDTSNGTSKRSPKSPWLFHIGPYYYARKNRVLAAQGFVRLTGRWFRRHKIREGDIVQVLAGWDDRYTGCYAQVEKQFFENFDLRFPAPHPEATQMLKLRNVPAGALVLVGKRPPTRIRANRRRNPNKILKRG